MARQSCSAEALRDALNAEAHRLSSESAEQKIAFDLPTSVPAHTPGETPNWDVQAECAEGFEEIAQQAVLNVASWWDLEE